MMLEVFYYFVLTYNKDVMIQKERKIMNDSVI